MTAPRPGQAGSVEPKNSGASPSAGSDARRNSPNPDAISPAPSAEIEARLEEPDSAMARQVADDLEHRSPIQSRWMRGLAKALDKERSTVRSLLAERERLERERDDYRRAWNRSDEHLVTARQQLDAAQRRIGELEAGLREVATPTGYPVQCTVCERKLWRADGHYPVTCDAVYNGLHCDGIMQPTLSAGRVPMLEGRA